MTHHLCLLLLLTSAYAITYKQFMNIDSSCSKIVARDCKYKITNPQIPLADPECSNDYYKSQLCFTYFKDCNDLTKQPQNEMPVFCWKCWAETDAKSQKFSSYQTCLKSSMFDGKLAVMLGAIIIMALLML